MSMQDFRTSIINRNTLIGFLGTGIFTYLSISSLTYIFYDIIKDILMIMKLKTPLVFWVSESLQFLFFLFLINYTLNHVSNNYELIARAILKYFIWSFAIYFGMQLFQIIYPSLKPYFKISDNETTKYYDYLKNNYLLYFVQSIFYYLREIIIILLIYDNIKRQ